MALPRDRFRDFAAKRGLKLTKERKTILDEILDTQSHFDPEGLFVRLRGKGSKVSRASVYRMIPLLLESGIIAKVERTDKHAHYERVLEGSHHDHMICLGCGAVIEFYSAPLERLQEEICRKERFVGLRHSLEILGYCGQCGDARGAS
jgi:Fur family ferric uptake transcriptional regulator